MSLPHVLYAAPAAARALIGGSGGTFELVLSGGAYARFGHDWLLLTEPSQPFGPLSVAVAGLDRLDLRPGVPVRVAQTLLVVGQDTVRLERMRERGVLDVRSLAPGPESAIAEACGAALAGLPGPPESLRGGIDALAAGRSSDAVRSLAGLGEGLTPAGDDVLAGYAAAQVAFDALSVPNRTSASTRLALSTLAGRRSSALGLAYLRCAERGELPDAGARLLGAICRGSAMAAQAALPSLSAWGASSGAALGWGMTAAVRERLRMQFNREE